VRNTEKDGEKLPIDDRKKGGKGEQKGEGKGGEMARKCREVEKRRQTTSFGIGLSKSKRAKGSGGFEKKRQRGRPIGNNWRPMDALKLANREEHI